MKRTFYLLISLIGLALIGATNRGHAQSAIHGTTQLHSGGHLGVYSSLSFVSGMVVTPRNEPTANIVWTAGTSHSGASNSSHVNGYAEKIGNSAFTFPVGDGTKLRTASISVPASASAVYRAAYFSGSPGSATLPVGAPFSVAALGAGVTTVSLVEYWDVDGTEPIDLTLTWDAASNLNTLVAGDISKLSIVGYNTSTSQWQKLTTGTTSGTLVGTGSITATGVVPNTYAAFTFGSTLPNGVNLVTTKVSPAVISQFTPFSYTMTVKNTGAVTSSGTITVVDTLKNGLKFLSGAGTGWTITKTGVDGSGNDIVTATTSAALATGNSSAFTLTVNPTIAGGVSNRSWTSGGGMPGGPFGSGPTEGQAGETGNPGGTVTGPTNVDPKPNLVVTKVNPATPVIQNIDFNYSFIVKNTGSLASSGAITVVDTLKNGLTFVSGTGSGWTVTKTGVDGSGNDIVQAVSSTPIAVNATSSYSLTVKPTQAVPVSNVAWTSGGGMPGGPYKSGSTEANAGSASNPTGGTATTGTVIPGTPCDPIEPGTATASVPSVQTGGSASFTLSGNGTGTTTWAVFPNLGVSPTSGSGTSTGNLTFTYAGEYQVIFTTTTPVSGSCNQPTTAIATTRFLVTSPLALCTTPGSSSVVVSPTSAAIPVGANASFTLSGGTPSSSVQWFAIPTTGVTPTAGSGTGTGSITFANSGLYNIVFAMLNMGDGSCVPVQKTSSALIAVGLNACSPPSSIVLTSTATSNTSNIGQTVTVSATGGLPNQGTLSWVVTNSSNATVASGFGTPANINFTQPGLYSITFKASNSSTPVGCTSPVTISNSITHLVVGTAPGVTVASKVFLAGPLSGSQMTTNLRNNNLIPTTDPYGKGTTTTSAVVGSSSPTGNNAIVDWILVELRSSPTAVVESKAALLQADGDIVSTDGTSPVSFSAAAGSYYVAVRHRNHLGVMTATALPLTSAATAVDFTSVSTATYGTNAQRTVGSVRALWAGNAVSTPAAELVRYSGSNNDPGGISSLVTAGGTAPITSIVSNVYSNADLDLNGSVRYSGSNNDISIISGSIINHPGNPSQAITYIVSQTFN